MSKARRNSTDQDLVIYTDRPGPYYPGDSISGQVVRGTHVISPSAQVTIHLSGSTEVGIWVEDAYSGETCHVSRADLIGNETSERLFDGPIHIPPSPSPQECLSWPFSITIPLQLAPGADTHTSSQTIPPSFFVRARDSYYGKTNASVWYYLSAQFYEQHSNRTSRTAAATLPVTILPASARETLQDVQLRHHRSNHRVWSQRLLPGMELAQLSFWDRVRKRFHAPGVPRYGFDVIVSCPSRIQLEAANPVHFSLCIAPSVYRSSPAVENESLPIRLAKLTLALRSRTDVSCAGLGLEGFKTAEEPVSAQVVWSWVEGAMPIVPCGPDVMRDIGASMDLRFGATWAGYSCVEPGLVESGEKVRLTSQGRLYPDFATCNIWHQHTLEWKIELMVVGEVVKVRGRQATIILGV